MILETEVAYTTDFEEMTLRRAPVEAYAPGSHATATYRQLLNDRHLRSAPALGLAASASRSFASEQRRCGER